MNLVYSKFYIGGQWVQPATSNVINVVSASTEEFIGQVPEASEADVDVAVVAARRAFDDPTGWAHLDPVERNVVLERFAGEIESRSAETVQRVSSQNGMPVSVGGPSEGTAPAVLLRYYIGLMAELPTEEVRDGVLGGTTVVSREPIGVVAAIVPWNFPQSLTFMKLAPALAAGCTVVLKPSPETVLDSYLVAEAAEAAGLPPGVLNIVPGGREVGAHLVSHPGIDKVSFTGSTDAGRQVGEVCGRLLRPMTLELGGKSAAIVLDDADLAPDLEKFFAATLLNSGQTCYLGTRVLAPPPPLRRGRRPSRRDGGVTEGGRCSGPADPARSPRQRSPT